MAEKTLNTRFILRNDFLSNWTSVNPVLKKGEIAIVSVPASSGSVVQEPATLIKVGDGVSNFNDLPYLSGVAADVYDWAKASAKPTYSATEITGLSELVQDAKDSGMLYGIRKISDYEYHLTSKLAGNKGEYADVEGATIVIPNDTQAITNLQALVGDTAVATQIANAIAALNLAATYDEKGSAAAAQTAAETKATELNTAMDTRVKALEGKFGEGEGTVEAQIKVEKERAEAAEKAIKESIGTVTAGKTVVEMIDDANTAMNSRVSAIEADYLKTADKTALETKVSDEKTRAEGAEEALAQRVSSIEQDYLQASDKTELSNATTAVAERTTELETRIASLASAMHFVGVKNEVPTDLDNYTNGDVIYVGNKEYVFADGTFHEFGDVTEETQRISALETQVTNEELADTLAGRVKALETANVNTGTTISNLQDADTAMQNRLLDLENAKTANDAKNAEQDAALNGINKTLNGNTTGEQSDGGIIGRLTELEDDHDTLAEQFNTAIHKEGTGILARLAATEAVANAAAKDADLAVIAKTGNVNDLIQTDGDWLILDGGNASGINGGIH